MVAAKCVQNLQSMYRKMNSYIVKELSMMIGEKFTVTSSETKYVQDLQSMYKRLFLYTLSQERGDDMQEIIAKDVVKSTVATTPRQAMTLARQVQMLSQDKSEITINFAGITTITAVFANRLLEQLHELFGDEVWQYVKLDLASLSSHQRETIELVMTSRGRKLTEDEIGSEVD